MESISVQHRTSQNQDIQPDYFQMIVEGKVVSMCTSDNWLNAIQILELAGKNDKQVRWTLGLLKKQTSVEIHKSVEAETSVKEETATTPIPHPAWVCYEHGRFLCEVLNLTDELWPLLDIHP